MKVLVVASSHRSRRQLVSAARSVGGPEVVEAESSADAMAHASRHRFDLLLVVERLGPDPSSPSGLELAARLAREHDVLTIVVDRPPDLPTMRMAWRAGIHDWIDSRHFDTFALQSSLDELLRSRAAAPRLPAPVQHRAFGAPPLLIGESPAMERLRDTIGRLARTEHPVLVTGPSGSGKELVVRDLHRRRRGPESPFIPINCGAIPDNLLESQLFGHKRGAFTGADRDQEGYLSAVGNGCLFLDEIAELPLALQAKLLRVLETGTYCMVGATTECRFHGRVVAATHADLERRCGEGRFREDLYYRLAVLELHVPALAERVSDIPQLLVHFVSQQDRHFEFSDAALELLAAHRWPGNVRELRNFVARVAVLSDENAISREVTERLLARPRAADGEHALASFADSVLRLDLEDKLDAAQDVLIARTLERCGGNKSAAARTLGVHRKVLERRLGKQRFGEFVQ